MNAEFIDLHNNKTGLYNSFLSTKTLLPINVSYDYLYREYRLLFNKTYTVQEDVVRADIQFNIIRLPTVVIEKDTA